MLDLFSNVISNLCFKGFDGKSHIDLASLQLVQQLISLWNITESCPLVSEGALVSSPNVANML